MSRIIREIKYKTINIIYWNVEDKCKCMKRFWQHEKFRSINWQLPQIDGVSAALNKRLIDYEHK